MTTFKDKDNFIKEKSLINLFNSLFQDFPVHGFFFLNEHGKWQETPHNWLDRIKSETLFWLKGEKRQKRLNIIEVIIGFLEKIDFCFSEKVELALRNCAWNLEKLNIRAEEFNLNLLPGFPCSNHQRGKV